MSTTQTQSGTDIKALNKYLETQGMTLSDGYGKLKDKTFRIAHMGDLTLDDLTDLFTAIGAFLEKGA